MLQLLSNYDSEALPVEVDDRFRERVNNATATAIMLAQYTKQLSDPDGFELSLVTMVADGIGDMLMTAIEEFEDNVEREELREGAKQRTACPDRHTVSRRGDRLYTARSKPISPASSQQRTPSTQANAKA